MSRRRITLTLLLILAVQLLGAMALASACFEPCPDDTDETSCPPVCTLCTSCTHAQQAILQPSLDRAPLVIAHPIDGRASSASIAPPADDIFHVPLAG